jgi:type IV secretory pathway VirB2 component (pilin)
MSSFAQIHTSLRKSIVRIRSTESKLLPLVALRVLVPLAAHARGSPFDNGFTAWQALLTRTVANVAGLIAIVIGGYQFARGGPGGKTALAGVAAGTAIAVLAAKRSDLPLARLSDETNSERSYPYPIEQ